MDNAIFTILFYFNALQFCCVRVNIICAVIVYTDFTCGVGLTQYHKLGHSG